MNYNSIYEKLITNAKSRSLDGYTERHHITPQCLGGSDDALNLVDLTPEEHYLAHQLLVKIHPDNASLIYAARMMTISSPKADRSKNKLFGWLRRKNQEVQKNKEFTAETRKKMSESAKNKPKITCPHCGLTGTEGNMRRWHFDNCKQGPTPKIVKLDQETKDKIIKTMATKIWKEDSCPFCGLTTKLSALKPHIKFCKSNPNRKKKEDKKIKCPHCDKIGIPANMRRWHFDNCKHKPH